MKKSSRQLKMSHMIQKRKIITLFLYFFLFLAVLLSAVACNAKGTPKDSVNILITKDGLKTMQIALELYKNEFGKYPETLEEILRYKGITEQQIIEDAWGREYHYLRLGKTYVLFSKGRDGKSFTEDDIYPGE